MGDFLKVSLSEEEGEPTFIVTMDGIDEQYFKYKQKKVYTMHVKNTIHVKCIYLGVMFTVSVYR